MKKPDDLHEHITDIWDKVLSLSTEGCIPLKFPISILFPASQPGSESKIVIGFRFIWEYFCPQISMPGTLILLRLLPAYQTKHYVCLYCDGQNSFPLGKTVSVNYTSMASQASHGVFIFNFVFHVNYLQKPLFYKAHELSWAKSETWSLIGQTRPCKTEQVVWHETMVLSASSKGHRCVSLARGRELFPRKENHWRFTNKVTTELQSAKSQPLLGICPHVLQKHAFQPYNLNDCTLSATFLT